MDKSLLSEPHGSPFGSYFEIWRRLRVQKLLNHLGEDWFKGKKILEMGCGYGNIGAFFESMGAIVHYSDVREECLSQVLKRNPKATTFCMDQESDWSLEDSYDLIIHFGLLLHINYWERDLEKVLDHCSGFLALETAVNKYNDHSEYKIYGEYCDKLHGTSRGIGTLTSAQNIENVFTRKGFTWKRFDDADLNAAKDHLYHEELLGKMKTETDEDILELIEEQIQSLESYAFYDWKSEDAPPVVSNEYGNYYEVLYSWWDNPHNDGGKRRFWLASK